MIQPQSSSSYASISTVFIPCQIQQAIAALIFLAIGGYGDGHHWGDSGTIVSKAAGERIKFGALLLFIFFLVGISYAVTGHCASSSNGWLLNTWKFRDFAGSTVVYSVERAATLVGIILLEPL